MALKGNTERLRFENDMRETPLFYPLRWAMLTRKI